MLYLCDLDGTLLENYMFKPDREYHSWKLLPGRKKKIQRLMAEGHQIGIITNQGGVAFGFVNPKDVMYKIRAVLKELGVPSTATIQVAYHHPDAKLKQWRSNPATCKRKPSGQMILDAAHETGFDLDDIVYIGDRSEDRAAAEHAGVQFYTEKEFFGS